MATTAHPPAARHVLRHRVGRPFPPDGRVRVGQPAGAPWSGLGLVRAGFPDGTTAEATGFVIGATFALTTAHVVDAEEWGGKARWVEFQPARDGRQTPFGTHRAAVWHYPRCYPLHHRIADDYCLLTLAAPVPPGVFRYPLRAADEFALCDTEFQLGGYPVDRRPENSLWFDTGKLTKVGERLLSYRMSASGGVGGTALATYLDNRGTAAVGIHVGASKEGDANLAVRLTARVLDQITAWQRGAPASGVGEPGFKRRGSSA